MDRSKVNCLRIAEYILIRANEKGMSLTLTQLQYALFVFETGCAIYIKDSFLLPFQLTSTGFKIPEIALIFKYNNFGPLRVPKDIPGMEENLRLEKFVTNNGKEKSLLDIIDWSLAHISQFKSESEQNLYILNSSYFKYFQERNLIHIETTHIQNMLAIN